jgi:hypothetical protein
MLLFQFIFLYCVRLFLYFVYATVIIALIYSLYQTAGALVVLGVVCFIAWIGISEERKTKAQAAYNIEHGIDASSKDSKGLGVSDLALGWCIWRVFKK